MPAAPGEPTIIIRPTAVFVNIVLSSLFTRAAARIPEPIASVLMLCIVPEDARIHRPHGTACIDRDLHALCGSCRECKADE